MVAWRVRATWLAGVAAAVASHVLPLVCVLPTARVAGAGLAAPLCSAAFCPSPILLLLSLGSSAAGDVLQLLSPCCLTPAGAEVEASSLL